MWHSIASPPKSSTDEKLCANLPGLRRLVNQHVLAFSCPEQEAAERPESGAEHQADDGVNATVIARVRRFGCADPATGRRADTRANRRVFRFLGLALQQIDLRNGVLRDHLLLAFADDRQ